MVMIKAGPLAFWPLRILGNYKYVIIYLPFVIRVMQTSLKGEKEIRENLWFHLLLASALRYVLVQLWMSVTRFHGLVKKYKIQTEGVTFAQKDRESNWDNYILLQFLVAAAMVTLAPGFRNFPFWNAKGFVCLLLLHAGPVELLYYWGHRFLHQSPTLYKRYHAYHHASVITEPTSGFMLTFAEHLVFAALVSIPLLGTGLLGVASSATFYCYWLLLDCLSAVGHCNWEFVPTWVFKVFPLMKYLLYTPTYHSLHHSNFNHDTNFALSMPLYDHLGGTFDKHTDTLHATVRKGRSEKPDFVFLAHEIGLDSVLHLQMSVISFHTVPFTSDRWFVWLLWPITVPIMILMWIFGSACVGCQYRLNQFQGQTWVMPRFGFQYFLPSEKPRINKIIEQTMLEADEMGVKVLTLGALNKNEALNDGGTRFIKRLPNLRVRICHGNTLTAAVILNGLPKDVTEIFLTGATSKLGRAISLYLSRRNVRVLMLTTSHERFKAVLDECPQEYKHNLVQVTSYKDACNCKTWVVGKWASPKDQSWAPAGTRFNQFVVPIIQESRQDCTYGALAAMNLPKHVKELDTCEINLPRGVVHACHAGGLVHLLEGWTHHELGPIPIDRIDIVWKAAMKHGFSPLEKVGLLQEFIQGNVLDSEKSEHLLSPAPLL